MAHLLRGGRILSPDSMASTALLIEHGRIAWIGTDDDADGLSLSGARITQLDGALLTPGFVDAHVHATSTGMTLLGLELSGTRSAVDLLDAVAREAMARPGAVILGHGWDESRWPDRTLPTLSELDLACRGARMYLTRVDSHSALVSSALMLAAPASREARGFDESGWVTQEAHHVLREAALGSIDDVTRTRAQEVFLDASAQHGIVSVHEMAGPVISSQDDCAQLLARAAERIGTHVVAYWGELAQRGGIDTARELGARGTGGDLFVDGSLGSHTACMHDAYLDAPETRGREFIDQNELLVHIIACMVEGQQTGFHAIGDAANDAVLSAFAKAAALHGHDRVRDQRHRIEHAESLQSFTIAECARLGLLVSMQPVFDQRWGGDEGMYAQRLGRERASLLNPIGELMRHGVSVAFGSDAPVTPLDPWGAIHAAMNHRNTAQRIDRDSALDAHSRAGWHAAGVDDAGRIVVGERAHVAIWDAVIPGMLPAIGATSLLTIRDGHVIHDAGALQDSRC